MNPRSGLHETLMDTYRTLGLPVDLIHADGQFAVHNLADIHPNLPFTSTVFRTNYFSFVFVKDGEGRYTTDEQSFKTTPGMIYFTNPGHYKSFHWDRVGAVWLITMSEAFLKENVHHDVFKEFSFLLAETVPPKVLEPAVFGEFEQLYLQINKEYFGDSPYKYRMIGNLFVVLLLKIKEYFWQDYNPIQEGNRSSQIVKLFKRHLEKHYRDLLTDKADKAFRVQDYAELQNLHPNYLSNVIKSKTGKAIGTWITEKTIAEAKSLLQNSTISIKEIAYKLGFSESSHFSNYFSKHAEISPAAYRKQQNVRGVQG
ncbi:MAG TPA: AraC family transcriptional regulator [Puia sp.]|nr:AraC family transcriptional regulator [Puia sp.]